ncbi:hypothetical protein [Undibacterium sp. TS12]|uniref:hypothetical protein n=1 Tax=Undibacterium sp. TS12 TaxID=2908202 RepID=UPI001F4CF4FF|nr:hypothetical protein [Undibacterium sp. TS12]MCH8622773.1 hypothetical protein [Undibacterium sp. TS12]
MPENYDYAALLDPNLSDLEVAIAGLKLSIQAMKESLAARNAMLEPRQAQRRQLVDSQVQSLLPDFSSTTLMALEQQCPGFVDDLVRETFRENRKILGLFTRSGSGHALVVLKTRLAYYLERHQGKGFEVLDEEIAAIRKLVEATEQLRFANQNLLQSLERLRDSGAVIPPDLQEDITRLAARTRELARRYLKGGATTAEPDYSSNSVSTNDYYSYRYDDHRAWVYLGSINDLDAVADTAANVTDDSTYCDDVPRTRDTAADCASDQVQSLREQGTDAAATILTDDSLGSFS